MGKENKSTPKKIKDRNLNVKLPTEDYEFLQKIAEEIGGMTLSTMIRIKIYSGLDKVKKTGNSRDFLDLD